MLIIKRLLIASTIAGLLASCSMFQSSGTAPVETGGEQGGTAYPDVSSPDAGSPYNPPQTTSPYGGAPSANTGAPTGSYTPSNAPVDINAAAHTVVYGDTIYNVAKRYGITQDNLMQWNNLMDYNIQIGQVLNVKGSGYVAPTQPVVVQPTTPPQQPAVVTSPSVTSSPATPPSSNAGVKNVAGIAWGKPTAAAAVTNFGGANKGIDYGGSLGQAIVSAADGKVVYSGSGLKGYGNLIIIQHNSRYLTAYGNNQSLLVKEGQQVKRGQKIATMGNTDANRVKLHFEVREDGKPVNPTRFLP